MCVRACVNVCVSAECEGSAERKTIVQRLELRTPNLSDVSDWLCVRGRVAAQRRYRGVRVCVCVILGWQKQSSGAEVKEWRTCEGD